MKPLTIKDAETVILGCKMKSGDPKNLGMTTAFTVFFWSRKV
jgi:hypothetical protein